MVKRNITAKRRMIERKPELVRATFRCPHLDKLVDVDSEDMNFSGDSSPCDLCGSHGSVTVNFLCECGDRHYVTLYDY
jgi:transcription elongation factor Elf1